MATQSRTYELTGWAGGTTAVAESRHASTTGTITLVSVVEPSGGFYFVTLSWDDAAVALGKWLIRIGTEASPNATLLITLDGETTDVFLDDAIGNVPSAAEIVAAVEADGGMLDGVAAAVGSSGVYTITVTCKESDDTPVSGARVTIQGTSYTETSGTDGIVRFNVSDEASYTLVTTPPSGYQTPANVVVAVSGADVPVSVIMTTAAITPPEDPAVCRVMSNVVTIHGTAAVGAVIVLKLPNGVACRPATAIANASNEFVVDDTGMIEIDMIQGIDVNLEITLDGRQAVLQYRVPDEATATLDCAV